MRKAVCLLSLARVRNKDKKKNKEKEKDIFDDLIKDKATKAPRMSMVVNDSNKDTSSTMKKPASFFNMSGGNNEESEESSDNAIKELEEENKRLQGLIEYKDYELKKKKKEEEFGYDWFSDLRQQFDINLKELEDKNSQLSSEKGKQQEVIEQLQAELSTKDKEISDVEEKYKSIIEQQKNEHKAKMDELQAKLSTHSEEIVDNFKKEIEDLKKELSVVENEKNKYLDEKLKIEEIIDKQIEQVEYFNNRWMKLEDELQLRKDINNEMTKNLQNKEEEIRILKLEKEENVIKSFDVKFINIEESKPGKENLTKGTVQTCQSRENSKDFFIRITYASKTENKMKSFKVEADCLGGIIPITENRAAIQWKENNNMKKQEIELDDPEELLLEIGNITYR